MKWVGRRRKTLKLRRLDLYRDFCAIAARVNSSCAPHGPRKPKTPEPQDAFEMSKQHLDGLAIAARSLESLGFRRGASNVVSVLVDIAHNPARGTLRNGSCGITASRICVHSMTRCSFSRQAKIRPPLSCFSKHSKAGGGRKTWCGKSPPSKSTSRRAARRAPPLPTMPICGCSNLI